ncbi:hypothetical protein [uncultured Maribacter sp.]|uniref:hypothetical protein n=1 Tax=uncultured Maribacter sp. TaxID=431308 RepID=UPI00262E78F1|nr:hypothetical protein [uncultured Maribacter sp.]
MKKIFLLMSASIFFTLQSCEKNDIETDTISILETLEEQEQARAIRGLKDRERGQAE